jgi:uncharacterized protein
MKHLIFLLCLLASHAFLYAQKLPYDVVFDLTSKDTSDHSAVIRWINAISKDRPDARMEVVLYGQSLDMVQKEKSSMAPAIQQLTQNKNVAFKVCAMAMKKHNIDASQLLPGVVIVPDGIFEIVSREKEGWGYIKVSH